MNRFKVLGLACLLFASCASKKKENEMYLSLYRGQLDLRVVLQQEIEEMRKQLLDKATYDIRKDKAEAWVPKTVICHQLILHLSGYLDSLKGEVKEAAQKGESVERIFRENGQAAVLWQRIRSFQQAFQNIDPEVEKEFARVTILKDEDLQPGDADVFYERYLSGSDALWVNAWLNQLQGNLISIEHRFLQFCLMNTQSLDGSGMFQTLHPLVGQSASALRAGDTLVLEAGIGSFTRAGRPRVRFGDGRIQFADDAGIVRQRTIVPRQPGVYQIPVRVQFTDENGRDTVQEYTIRYRVLADCK